jgi:hypothetical protein
MLRRVTLCYIGLFGGVALFNLHSHNKHHSSRNSKSNRVMEKFSRSGRDDPAADDSIMDYLQSLGGALTWMKVSVRDSPHSSMANEKDHGPYGNDVRKETAELTFGHRCRIVSYEFLREFKIEVKK